MIDSGKRYEIDDSIMLRGIVNQYYVADISKKIKSVKTNLKKEGYFVEHSVPYGYKKEGEEKHKVLIDENVAENVKLIFSMYLQGYSQGKIAKHLTSLNIDTPKTYKGGRAAINEWRNDTIGRILKDPFYTGKIIINKYVNDYRIKKTKKTPRKDWIMVDGKHEPLISNEDFNLVQKMLQDNFSKPKQEYNYLLKGLVYCGHCKSRMQYKLNTRKMKNDDIITRPTCKDNLTSNKVLGHPLTIFDCVSGSGSYKCRMLYRFPSICNRGHTIMEKYLNEIVLESLKKRLSHFRIDEYTGKVIDEYKNNNANYKLLEQYKKKKKKLEVNITTLYNKKLEKIICVEDFKEEYANLKSEMENTQSQITNLEKLCNNNLIDDKIKEIIVNFKKGKDFDNETMKVLIDRIEVYEDMKIDIIYKI